MGFYDTCHFGLYGFDFTGWTEGVGNPGVKCPPKNRGQYGYFPDKIPNGYNDGTLTYG